MAKNLRDEEMEKILADVDEDELIDDIDDDELLNEDLDDDPLLSGGIGSILSTNSTNKKKKETNNNKTSKNELKARTTTNKSISPNQKVSNNNQLDRIESNLQSMNSVMIKIFNELVKLNKNFAYALSNEKEGEEPTSIESDSIIYDKELDKSKNPIIESNLVEPSNTKNIQNPENVSNTEKIKQITLLLIRRAKKDKVVTYKSLLKNIPREWGYTEESLKDLLSKVVSQRSLPFTLTSNAIKLTK